MAVGLAYGAENPTGQGGARRLPFVRGRHALAAAARDAASKADVLSQILWWSALAQALAVRGKVQQPLALVDQAARLAHTTERPNVLADTLLDQACVLRALGRSPVRAAELADPYVANGNRAGRARVAALAGARGGERLPQTKEGSR